MNKPIRYPSAWEEWTRLDNGARVMIRPIHPEDAPRLQASFRKLTPESVYMRFLESFKELSDEQAEYFATVDYQTRMAFVGTITEDRAESVIGVARYDVINNELPLMAECAVIVRDDYHGLGLGKKLMSRLASYAYQNGITAFIGTIHHANTRMMSFIKDTGLTYEREIIEPGLWEVRVILGEIPG